MKLTECPYCNSKRVEEHGTEPGEFNWWLCRECGGAISGNEAEYRQILAIARLTHG